MPIHILISICYLVMTASTRQNWPQGTGGNSPSWDTLFPHIDAFCDSLTLFSISILLPLGTRFIVLVFLFRVIFVFVITPRTQHLFWAKLGLHSFYATDPLHVTPWRHSIYSGNSHSCSGNKVFWLATHVFFF